MRLGQSIQTRPKVFGKYRKVSFNILRMGEEVLIERRKAFFEVVRKSVGLLKRNLYHAFFTGVRQFIHSEDNVEVRLHVRGGPVVDANDVISRQRFYDLLVI